MLAATLSTSTFDASDPSTPGARPTFDVYLDDIGGFCLMTATEERSQAAAIAEAKVDLWNALLSLPSRVESLLDRVTTEIPGDACPTAQIDELLRSVRVLRAERSAASLAAYRNATAALARALARADIDMSLANACCRAIAEEGSADTTLGSDRPKAYAERVLAARGRLVALRNRFACANLRLVVKVAQRYGRTRMSLADRVQEGNIGLMKAIDRFDPSMGFRFSTYAAWWIRHAITRALINRGRTVRIPAHVHTLYVKMSKTEQHLGSALGREPTCAELSRVMGVPEDRVEQVRRAMHLRSVGLESPVSGSDTRRIEDVLEAPSGPGLDVVLDDRRNAAIVRTAVRELDPIEREVIERRFGLDGVEPMTLQKLGERFSLSRERIRQLQNRALCKLRTRIEQSPLPTTAFA